MTTPGATNVSRYEQLQKELESLRLYFLPNDFDPTGSYDETIYAHTSAYRVLAHAEFESYLEDRVLELAKISVSVWENEQRAIVPLLALLAFSGQEMTLPPDTLAPSQSGQQNVWDKKLKLCEKIKSALTNFCHRVKENHGIKEKNILGLLLPVGVKAEDVDPLLLASLNSFGKERGEIAHTSAISRISQRPDPQEELSKITQILDKFRHIDELLNQLCGR